MRQRGRYLVILILVVVLWNTMIMKPLKIFAVFLHEFGHSFMAVIFGNGIKGFQINFNESGYALTLPKNGFSAFMIANGGYLGSLLFALLILHLKKTALKNFILGTAGVLLLGVSIAYGKSLFTIIYAAIFAGIVLLLYMLNNEKLNDWVIDILGVSSAAYAVYDTFVDNILLEINMHFNLIPGWKTVRPLTDAVQLEKMTHVPAIIWGIIWFVLSCMAIYAMIRTDKRKTTGARKKGKF